MRTTRYQWQPAGARSLNHQCAPPLAADHPVVGAVCPACAAPFQVGDLTTLVELGPGLDPAERQRARDGQVYTAVCVPAHWACVTGEE